MFPGPLDIGVYKKAREKKLWALEVVNIRDYATDKHKTVDDTPFGGGSSMLMSCLLYTSPSPRDGLLSRMPSSA